VLETDGRRAAVGKQQTQVERSEICAYGLQGSMGRRRRREGEGREGEEGRRGGRGGKGEKEVARRQGARTNRQRDVEGERIEPCHGA